MFPKFSICSPRVLFSIETSTFIRHVGCPKGSPLSHLNSWKSKVELLRWSNSFQLLQEIMFFDAWKHFQHIFYAMQKQGYLCNLGFWFSSSSLGPNCQLPTLWVFHKCLRRRASPLVLSMWPSQHISHIQV
jgi:hypothetical protein